MYLNFSRKTKVSDFEEFVIGNEHITAGKITMNDVQTGQVLLQNTKTQIDTVSGVKDTDRASVCSI